MNYYKYDKEKRRSRPVFCRLCGTAIKINDYAMMFSGKAVCSSCISEINEREIIRLCEFSSKEELLYSLGFVAI